MNFLSFVDKTNMTHETRVAYTHVGEKWISIVN